MKPRAPSRKFTLTVTRFPLRAKRPPSYHLRSPPPQTLAPPWNQTATGREAPASGVFTVRVRQSSLWGSVTGPMGMSRSDAGWGAIGARSTASRTPFQGCGGCGGAKRSSPTGGLA